MTRNTRAAFLILTAVFVISLLLPPAGADGRIDHMPSICPFHRLTGLPCPGCGLTRAFVCLSHGQFVQSLHWHPIGWLVYAVFGLLWARTGLTWVLGRPFAPVSARTSQWLNWSAVATLLLVGAVRIGWTLAHPALRLP